MKIKIFICVLLAIILIAAGVFVYNTTGNKSDTDEGNAIRVTIEKALRIQYGWQSKSNINDISTKAFQKTLDENTFYKGLILYHVDKNFMVNVKNISENEVEVVAPVWTPDFSISAIKSDDDRPVFRTVVSLPVFTLIKTEDGSYLIKDLHYD